MFVWNDSREIQPLDRSCAEDISAASAQGCGGFTPRAYSQVTIH